MIFIELSLLFSGRTFEHQAAIPASQTRDALRLFRNRKGLSTIMGEKFGLKRQESWLDYQP
jgi:hypothetical protein